jgi:thiol-disulfide isomerase/thioredoxin
MKRSFFFVLWFIPLVSLVVFVQCGQAKPPTNSDSTNLDSTNQNPADQGAIRQVSVGAEDLAWAFADAGLPVLKQRVASIDFSLPLVNKKNLALKDLRGKVVFLNFWATWCGPCRAEMPSMEALYQRFRDEGLEILAVNSGENEKKVAAFVEELNLSFPSALDTRGQVSGLYGIAALPTTYIIDREGNILSRVIGSINWNTPELFAAFEALLKS